MKGMKVAIVALVIATAISWGTIARSHEGDDRGAASTGSPYALSELHGGAVTKTKQHHFETVWDRDGLRIYMYTGEQAPMMVAKAGGTVTFRMKDGSTRNIPLKKETPGEKEARIVYFCPMHVEVVQSEPGICTLCGTMKLFVQDRLVAPFDLAGTAAGTLTAEVRLTGMKGKESDTTFTTAFTGITSKSAPAPARTEPGSSG